MTLKTLRYVIKISLQLLDNEQYIYLIYQLILYSRMR